MQSDKIEWKEGKDLVAKQPRKIGNVEELAEEDDAEIEGDVGSFFHFFTEANDPFAIGFQIVEELLPNAVPIFLGDDQDADELDDDEDEEDEDDEGSIDLEDDEDEKPPKKKQRN